MLPDLGKDDFWHGEFPYRGLEEHASRLASQ